MHCLLAIAVALLALPQAEGTAGTAVSAAHGSSPIPAALEHFSGRRSSADPGALEALPRQPLAFVENRGQWEGPARFVARRGGATVLLLPDSVTLQLVRRECSEPDAPALGVNVRVVFEGASGAAEFEGCDELPTLYNYFLGNDPGRWRMGVKGYERVSYRGLYEGVDLVVRERGPDIEYDLLVAPGADLGRVVVRMEGANPPLLLAWDGSLVIGTALGEIRQPPPTAWEEGERGERLPFRCSYRLLGENRFGFEAAKRSAGLALVVDPGLIYSTFLGGYGEDVPKALALEGAGAAVVAGWTSSYSNFPTTPGAYDPTFNGVHDAFVSRLPLTGGPPSYSTFLGGANYDSGFALALDATGAAVVAGFTSSTNFPTTPGTYDTTHNGHEDVFLTRLPLTGGPPAYSTFLGGSEGDIAYALALDAAGAVTLAGFTTSRNFPTTPGGYDPTHNGYGDAFVTRLPLTGGSPSYSTFLGGTNYEWGLALALDAMGAAVVAGYTSSPNYPTTAGAYDPTYNGGYDAFVTLLPLTGGPPSYSTFLGGVDYDWCGAIGLDATGAAVLAGGTYSNDFPTTPGAFHPTHGGFSDAFLALLPLTGVPVSYSTFLGGTSADWAYALVLDETGSAVVAGLTSSADFPTTLGSYDPIQNGGEAFVTRLPLTGGPPFYSTFLGGSFVDWAYTVTLDATEAAVIAGRTRSADFPTTPGAYDPTYNGTDDVFVTQLDLLPTGASAYGASTPGCAGPLPIGVTSWPQVGNAAFALTCGNAPRNSTGLLAFGAAGLATPLLILGAQLWIDPLSAPFPLLLVASNAIGATLVALPIPADPSLAGGQAYFQFFWPDPCAPGGVSASNALAITVQP